MTPKLALRKRHAVIIGAGPAGLTAAHELLSRAGDEWDVTLLEAADSIGGISRTVEHNGNRMDMGGHRFFSKIPRVNRWWQNRMPLQGAKSVDDKILGRDCPLVEGGPDPEREDQVMLSRHRLSRIFYGGKFFDYPVSLNVRTLRSMGFVTTLRVGFSYLHSLVRKLPETSLENFYVNRFGRQLYSMFFEGYTEKLWGRHPRHIAADWGAQRVKGLSISAVLRDAVAKAVGRKKEQGGETSLIECFWYPKFGPGQLWELVADEIRSMGGKVLLGAEASRFEVGDDGEISLVACSDGRCFESDYVMSSMPIKDLVAGLPDAPDEVREVAEGLPYRDFVTVGILVPSLALKNETGTPTLGGVVPDNWIYVQDSGVKLGRIQVFNNWSPYLVADPEHTVWLGLEYFCAEGDEFWRTSDEDLVRQAAGELRRMGVLSPGCPVIDFHVERIRKAYPAYFDTYGHIDLVRAWLDSHPNLACIGRNGQHRYNNMDHSMLTAFNAVEALLAGSSDRSRVWNVNTEAEYHEG